MIIVKVLKLSEDYVCDNVYGYIPADEFDEVGMFSVPFVSWDKIDKPNKIGVKETEGSIMLTKSKLSLSGLDIDSRLEIDNRIYRITSIMQTVNQVFDVHFVYVPEENKDVNIADSVEIKIVEK
jgi:hypothetical protein